METSKRARKRKLDIAKTDLEHLKRDESHVTERSAARVGRGRWQAKAGRKRLAARRVRVMKVDQFA